MPKGMHQVCKLQVHMMVFPANQRRHQRCTRSPRTRSSRGCHRRCHPLPLDRMPSRIFNKLPKPRPPLEFRRLPRPILRLPHRMPTSHRRSIRPTPWEVTMCQPASRWQKGHVPFASKCASSFSSTKPTGSQRDTCLRCNMAGMAKVKCHRCT